MGNKVEDILKGFRPPFYYETFEEFYNKCGFSRNDISELTNRTIKTIRHWEYSDAPKEMYILIYAASGYFLSKAFYGFKITDNKLFTGTRITYSYGFVANEIMEYSFFRDYGRSLERQNTELRKLINKENMQVCANACTPASISIVRQSKKI